MPFLCWTPHPGGLRRSARHLLYLAPLIRYHRLILFARSIMRISAAVILLLASSTASAQQFKMEPGPKSPADSLKCIQVRPGFTVELMAAEPLVMDPIAFAWGPDGKLWVVEMGDYPLGTDGKNKFGGKVKLLEKTKPDSDGPYDKATVFLDNLGYPTGVTPWGKGVIVT